MAGNLVSIMAATTQGRGGRRAETLPKFAHCNFSVPEKGNARFRCSACHVVLTGLIHRPDECPVCHTKNSIVTVTGREVKTRISHEKMFSNIKEKIRNNPGHYSKKDMTIELHVSYPTILLLCKALSLADLQLFRDGRGRSRKKEQHEEPTCEIQEIGDISPVLTKVFLPTEENIEKPQDEAQSTTDNKNDLPPIQQATEQKEVQKESIFFDDELDQKAIVAYELKEEGYRVVEIAKLLSVSPGTVYWYLKRVRDARREVN